MAMVDHENIVEYYCSMLGPIGEVYMVMEWLDAKEILELALPFDEKLDHVRTPQTFSKSRIAQMMKELSSAIHYLHEKGIAHFDIHVRNILITNKEGKVKLIDFGASVIDFEDKQVIIANHPIFWAPEVFLVGMKKDDGTLYTIGRQVDCFSLGVIAYILYKNALPAIFNMDYVKHISKLINPAKWSKEKLEKKRQEYRESVADYWSKFGDSNEISDKELRQLISLLTNVDVKSRWAACFEKYDAEYENLSFFESAEIQNTLT